MAPYSIVVKLADGSAGRPARRQLAKATQSKLAELAQLATQRTIAPPKHSVGTSLKSYAFFQNQIICLRLAHHASRTRIRSIILTQTNSTTPPAQLQLPAMRRDLSTRCELARQAIHTIGSLQHSLPNESPMTNLLALIRSLECGAPT